LQGEKIATVHRILIQKIQVIISEIHGGGNEFGPTTRSGLHNPPIGSAL